MAVKVKALIPFYDIKESRQRQQGEEWEVTKTRANEINSSEWCKVNDAKLVEVFEEPAKKEPASKARKKSQ